MEYRQNGKALYEGSQVRELGQDYAIETHYEAVQAKQEWDFASIKFRHEYSQDKEQDFLTIELPSCASYGRPGRKLFYARPFLAQAKKRINSESLHYYQTNQSTRKWGATDTWGGKLVENITQAVARDCIAETLLTLRAAGRNPVFHVHDEVICEVDSASELDTILGIMARPIEWAPGLPLKGAGFTCEYYQKD